MYEEAIRPLELHDAKMRKRERTKVQNEKLVHEKTLALLKGPNWESSVAPSAAKRGNYNREELLAKRERRITEIEELLSRMALFYKREDELDVLLAKQRENQLEADLNIVPSTEVEMEDDSARGRMASIEAPTEAGTESETEMPAVRQRRRQKLKLIKTYPKHKVVVASSTDR